MAALGRAVAGSPATVRAALAADIEASGVTYLLCRLAFGDMAYEEAACSAGLFAREVMPALREAG
jgi:alkanesulfonate monooxygenase SsuD/methylene tetrahydromethanopterin reductase-like flavin-dependent oxidoreductase (luciferase family)